MGKVHFDGEVLFAELRKTQMFRRGFRQEQVDGINRLIDVYCEHVSQYPLDDLAYDCGTAYHETAHTMQPITERGPRSYFNKYEPGTRLGRVLGNTQPGDGYKFRGEGDVQNTGRRNARVSGRKLSKILKKKLDFEKDPDGRGEPLNSALCLFVGNHEGWWTGKKHSDYKSYLSKRRIVNGTDRAQLIAGYARAFQTALKASLREGPAPGGPGDTLKVPPASKELTMLLKMFLSRLPGIISKLAGGLGSKGGQTTLLTTILAALGIETAGGDIPGITADLLKGDAMSYVFSALAAALGFKKVTDAHAEVAADEAAEINTPQPLTAKDIQEAIADVLNEKNKGDDVDEFATGIAGLITATDTMDAESWMNGFQQGAAYAKAAPVLRGIAGGGNEGDNATDR